MNGGGAEREGDTESETGSSIWAISQEPDAGLELTALTDREIMTWAEVGRLTNWATQAPLCAYIFNACKSYWLYAPTLTLFFPLLLLSFFLFHFSRQHFLFFFFNTFFFIKILKMFISEK